MHIQQKLTIFDKLLLCYIFQTLLECFILHTQDKILLVKKLELGRDFRPFCLCWYSKKQNQNFRVSYIFTCTFIKCHSANMQDIALCRNLPVKLVHSFPAQLCIEVSGPVNVEQIACITSVSEFIFLSIYELIGFKKTSGN